MVGVCFPYSNYGWGNIMIGTTVQSQGLQPAISSTRGVTRELNKVPVQQLPRDSRAKRVRKMLTDYFISRPLIYISTKLVSLYLKVVLLGKRIDSQQVRPLNLEETEKVNKFLDSLHTSASELIPTLDTGEVKGKVEQCYKDLGLMDQSGQWTRDIFQTVSSDLSLDISAATIKEEIDQVVRNIKDNPYLMRAIFDIIHAENMDEDMLNQGKAAIINELKMVLPFALALNMLTKAQIEHSEVLEGCVEIWKEKRNAMGGSIKGLGLKRTIKLVSVEQPILKMLKNRKKPDYSRTLGRGILPLNILEATALEAVQGSHDNASAGLALAKNYPGKYHRSACEFGGDRQELLLNYPMPKQWSDLYTTWNMQFCVDSADRPVLLSKLLISAVSGYQDNPRAFISRRAYALYSALNFLFFRTDTPDPVPALPTVASKAWGRNNRICSRLYQRVVRHSSQLSGGENDMVLAA